jgi:hypothetical protein
MFKNALLFAAWFASKAGFLLQAGEWSCELLLPLANGGKRKADHEDMKLDALQK